MKLNHLLIFLSILCSNNHCTAEQASCLAVSFAADAKDASMCKSLRRLCFSDNDLLVENKNSDNLLTPPLYGNYIYHKILCVEKSDYIASVVVRNILDDFISLSEVCDITVPNDHNTSSATPKSPETNCSSQDRILPRTVSKALFYYLQFIGFSSTPSIKFFGVNQFVRDRLFARNYQISKLLKILIPNIKL